MQGLRQYIMIKLLTIFFYSATFGQVDTFPKGKIIDTIYSLSNDQHSYSLYLPSTYTSDEKYPVLFVYDAGARGKLAVEKFQKAGEELAYIIVGSHNFRNGAFEMQLEAINQLFEDVPKRVAVDPNRYYTAGLSGGARMATTTAVLSKDIKGVIACAAGEILDYPIEQNAHFDFVSIAGNYDMNYLELYLLHEKLSGLSGVSHKRIEFEGGHEWPSQDQLLNALRWLDFLSMKKKLKEKNEELIAILIEEDVERASRAIEQKAYNLGYEMYADLLNNMTGWGDVSLAGKAINDEFNSQKWRATIDKKRLLIREEKRRQDEFNQSLLRIPFLDAEPIVKELRKELIAINEKEKEATDALEKMMWARLKGYVALTTFSQGSSFFKQGNHQLAISYFEIWEATNTVSYWMSYYLAKIYALSGKERQAIQTYKIAVKKGMKETGKKSKKELLQQLKDKEEFPQIIGHILNDFL